MRAVGQLRAALAHDCGVAPDKFVGGMKGEEGTANHFERLAKERDATEKGPPAGDDVWR